MADQEPPIGKVWACVDCGARLGNFHWNGCLGFGERVESTNLLVAVWPSALRKQEDE